MDKLLEEVYTHYNIDFSIEDIRDSIVCTPNFVDKLADLGIQINQATGKVHISSIGDDEEWIRCKLIMVRNHIK